MEKDILRVNQLIQEGKCCSQVMACMGLELSGESDPLFVKAAAGLCLGVRRGLTCGALTGAAMLLSLFDPQLAATEMIPELAEWFEETYGEAYGGVDCDSILENTPANKAMRCPALIENTYTKARELLEDYGFDLEDAIENLQTE